MIRKNSYSDYVKMVRSMEFERVDRSKRQEYNISHPEEEMIKLNQKIKKKKQQRKNKILRMNETQKKLIIYPLKGTQTLELPRMTKYVLVAINSYHKINSLQIKILRIYQKIQFMNLKF